MGKEHSVPLMDEQVLADVGTHLTLRMQRRTDRPIVHMPVADFDLDRFAARYLPVRNSSNYRQRRNFIGDLWMSKLGELRAYESLVERMVLLDIDRDPTIRRVWTQPFRVDGLDPERGDRYVRPTPDMLIEYTDDRLEVVEVKPSRELQYPNEADYGDDYEQFDKAIVRWQRLQAKLNYLETQLAPLGMTVAVRCEPCPATQKNLEYLSLYRRPLPKHDPLPERVMEQASRGPVELVELAEKVDGFVSTMPVILHLVWHRKLVMPMDGPIGPTTVVHASRVERVAA